MTVVLANSEISTIAVKHFLNVSRCLVTREILAGRLPHRMVGTHQCIPFDELPTYKERARGGRKEASQRLPDDAGKLDLEYQWRALSIYSISDECVP